MSDDTLDITPSVNLLRSLRGQRIDHVALLCEAIDNSFDHGARSIEITLHANSITIGDDGNGITRDRISAVCALGKHASGSTQGLGRFGVGIKEQSVNAGDTFQVYSCNGDETVTLSLDWQQILKSGVWKIAKPVWEQMGKRDMRGTRVTVGRLRKSPMLKMEKIHNDIASRYYPAIADHRAIKINGQIVALLTAPAMSDVIDLQLSLSSGRSAHLYAGILAGPSLLNRVHVSYLHRVLMPNSTFGCDSYSGLNKMFARVRIMGPWSLNKFKDGLASEVERDELEAAVEAALLPILEKVNAAAMTANIAAITQQVNASLPAELVAARPHRLGNITCTGKKRRGRPARHGYVAADKSDPASGPARTGKQAPQDKLIIDFEGEVDVDGIGTFRAGRPHRVSLSKDQSDIAFYMAQKDEEVRTRTLRMSALCIFEDGIQRLAEQELPFEPFGKKIAKHLASQ